MRDESEIQEKRDEAWSKADELDEEDEHLNAIVAMVVAKTLNWTLEEGGGNLDEDLLSIKDES